MIRVLPFEEINLVRRKFDPAKRAEYEARTGIVFPYREGTPVRVLLDDWSIEWHELIDGHVEHFRLDIQHGEVTDLSSVLRLLRWVVDRISMGDAAPFVHDLPYRYKGGPLPHGWLKIKSMTGGGWVTCDRIFTRREIDALFFAIQKADGIRSTVRWASWAGVRVNLFANRKWKHDDAGIPPR